MIEKVKGGSHDKGARDNALKAFMQRRLTIMESMGKVAFPSVSQQHLLIYLRTSFRSGCRRNTTSGLRLRLLQRKTRKPKTV